MKWARTSRYPTGIVCGVLFAVAGGLTIGLWFFKDVYGLELAGYFLGMAGTILVAVALTPDIGTQPGEPRLKWLATQMIRPETLAAPVVLEPRLLYLGVVLLMAGVFFSA